MKIPIALTIALSFLISILQGEDFSGGRIKLPDSRLLEKNPAKWLQSVKLPDSGEPWSRDLQSRLIGIIGQVQAIYQSKGKEAFITKGCDVVKKALNFGLV